MSKITLILCLMIKIMLLKVLHSVLIPGSKVLGQVLILKIFIDTFFPDHMPHLL